MSRRIFVNTLNSKFGEITTNRKGVRFGLGTPSELSPEEQEELGQRGNEVYFTSIDLLEKKRKIQVIYDSFTDPKFFGDGSVNVNVVNQILQEELEASRVRANNSFVNSFLSTTSPVFRLLRSNRQAGREDNAASWKMTRADFPRLTGQAIQGSSNRRSIERLYDDRQAIGGRNRSTKYAIARLTREALADALFSTVPTGGTVSLALPEHPLFDSNDALSSPRHFQFRDRTSGPNQTEQTYVDALIYLQGYIDLIDSIVNLRDQSLSRSPDKDQSQRRLELEVKLTTVAVPLYEAITETARQVIREKVLTFFDENREYKTLLNFGNDRQYVAEAWRLTPNNTGSVQLKLLTALDTDIDVDTTAVISREVAQTVVDTITFDFSPSLDTTPYLRPFNIDSSNQVASKMFATNATLETLGLATGSLGTTGTSVSYGDSVFRRWFTGDFKASELNVDFTDYKNFVHFGSAQKRLDAFVEKLSRIETLSAEIATSSVSSSVIAQRLKAQEKENIIRTFDPYEQFLFFATGSIPYSASAYYVSDEVEYNDIAYWPKASEEVPYSPFSVEGSNWYTAQSEIATRYDSYNLNALTANLPAHIQEDSQSEDYVTLFAMVGHMLDNIKVYIDQFPNIYSTKVDPFEELSMDQVFEVAQSFGLKLPNVYALENIQSLIGNTSTRSYVSETWKRFLHSMVYLYKTKGSRTSFDALLKTYGINSPVLQIKETGYPTEGNYIQSEELTYGLDFTSTTAQRIAVPLVSSSLTASTVQVSFLPQLRQSSSLVTGNGWAIDVVPHPSASKLDCGRIHVVSGSGRVVIASSSYFPLFSEDHTHLMLRSGSGDLTIIQTDGDQILYRESASINWGTLWNTTTTMSFGGTGSIKLGNFDGILDEIRVWGERITDSNFLSQAYDPGSYYASTPTSAYNSLFVHVPFSQPLTSVTSSVLNESPYQNVQIVSTLPAVGFTTASYVRFSRNVKQFVPGVGATTYTNKKITIAPPPVFNPQSVDGDGTRILNPKESIRRLEEKKYESGLNVVSFAIGPTDFINQNIIRSMGAFDVNDFIGSPRFIENSSYSYLDNIKRDYLWYYNKTVNPNAYIRFFKDLVEGPVEAAETMVPARAKLLDGIVIESSVLSRNKDYTVRSFAVDGSGTKKLDNFISGSGSIGIGAYDFSVGEAMSALPASFGDTTQIDASIVVPDAVNPMKSTISNKLPSFRKVIQRIGNQYVTASIMDSNSSYETLEANSIIGTPRVDTVSNGYPRTPFVGIPASGSVTKRLDSEDNTLIPFYDIQPRSNLNDVGTTTYFHKDTGIYSYDVYSLYKQPYLVKLDTVSDSPLGRLYAPITLLPPTTVIGEYGRNTTDISATTYPANGRVTGTIQMANLFTLYAISGPAGLRVRFYRNAEDLTADFNRNFFTIPEVNSGVLFDAILEGGERDVFPYIMMQTQDALIYYTIDNQTASPIATSLSFQYFAYEPDVLVPRGYLPRHYKYSRDNTTSLKRRNYLGCRDVNRTFDGQPPFVVTISTQNKVVVNNKKVPASAGNGIIEIPDDMVNVRLGGAGRLDVE